MAEVRFCRCQAAPEIMAVHDAAEILADMFAFRHHGADEAVQTGDADTAFARVSVVVIVADVIEIISIVEDADPNQFGIIFRVHGWLILSKFVLFNYCGMILKSFHSRNISRLNIARFFQKSSVFEKKRRNN